MADPAPLSFKTRGGGGGAGGGSHTRTGPGRPPGPPTPTPWGTSAGGGGLQKKESTSTSATGKSTRAGLQLTFQGTGGGKALEGTGEGGIEERGGGGHDAWVFCGLQPAAPIGRSPLPLAVP